MDFKRVKVLDVFGTDLDGAGATGVAMVRAVARGTKVYWRFAQVLKRPASHFAKFEAW